MGKVSLGLLATPAALIVVTVAAVTGLDSLGAIEAIPWFLRPILPAVLYTICLIALEFARLREELSYLKSQLRGGTS